MLPRINALDEPAGARQWLLNFDEEAYHADREAISQGALKPMVRSEAHFFQSFGVGLEKTPAMRIGTFVHRAILEPHRWAQYGVIPKFGDRRFKEPKALYAEWLKSLPTEHCTFNAKGERDGCDYDRAMLIEADDKAQVEAIAENLMKHEIFSQLIGAAGSINEATCYWTDPATKLWCRARLDIVSGANVLVDLKGTDDAREEAFQRTIENLLYHFQAAHYVAGASEVQGAPMRDFVFAAFEREAPYGVNCFLLDERALARGEAMRAASLEKLRACIEWQNRNEPRWPSYKQELKKIDLPPWAYKAGEGF